MRTRRERALDARVGGRKHLGRPGENHVLPVGVVRVILPVRAAGGLADDVCVEAGRDVAVGLDRGGDALEDVGFVLLGQLRPRGGIVGLAEEAGDAHGMAQAHQREHVLAGVMAVDHLGVVGPAGRQQAVFVGLHRLLDERDALLQAGIDLLGERLVLREQHGLRDGVENVPLRGRDDLAREPRRGRSRDRWPAAGRWPRGRAGRWQYSGKPEARYIIAISGTEVRKKSGYGRPSVCQRLPAALVRVASRRCTRLAR